MADRVELGQHKLGTAETLQIPELEGLEAVAVLQFDKKTLALGAVFPCIYIYIYYTCIHIYIYTEYPHVIVSNL